MSSRRGFLKMMGAAPLAAPIVGHELVKMQAAQEASALGGIYRGGLGAVGGYATKQTNVPDAEWSPRKAVLAAYKAGLIPKSQIIESLMFERLDSSQLDHDLIAAKSFSLSARYAMQKARHREKAWRDFLDDSPKNTIWDMARKLAGFE